MDGSLHKAMVLTLWCSACSGLFIIDAKGNLRQVTINDMPVGRSVDETLRLVQAFQFTDKHGEGEDRVRGGLSEGGVCRGALGLYPWLK